MARHGGRVTARAWSPDGETLASGGDDASVLLWDPDGGPPLGKLDSARAPRSVGFPDDGSVSVGWDDWTVSGARVAAEEVRMWLVWCSSDPPRPTPPIRRYE